MNIYEKQMKDLKLNPKEYAELTGIPYELVKDVIYDKEGNYSMEIKEFLRKNVFNKHQEIENDKENMKLKGMEMKMGNNNIDYLEWYNNEYTVNMITDKLQLKSKREFIKKYDILINGKRPSDWLYFVILGKKVDGITYKCSPEVQREFARQLYDILINGNGEEYLSKKENNVENKEEKKYYNKDGIKNSNKYIKWYKEFDILDYMNKKDINNNELSNKLNMAYSSTCKLTSKHYATLSGIKKLYDYINSTENEVEEITATTTATTFDEPVVIEMNNKIEEPVNIISQRTIEQDMFKKLLINRLTEEEKMLIELFGGKVE